MPFAAKDVLYISVYTFKAIEGDNNNAVNDIDIDIAIDIDTFGDQRNEIQLCACLCMCM